MNSPPQLNESERTFLKHLHDQVDDPAAADHASMYDIGAAAGMDRDTAKHTAENLISMGLVEIRTLAGEISLTEDGHRLCREQDPGEGGGGDNRLGSGPVLTEADRGLVEQMNAHLKTEAGDRSWQFDALTDLMADIKTIDAQLMSTQPKTAVIMACLQSVHAILTSAGLGDTAGRVGRLIGQ